MDEIFPWDSIHLDNMKFIRPVIFKVPILYIYLLTFNISFWLWYFRMHEQNNFRKK